MKEQSLIVTSGLPGSGKSTIAENIASALKVPLFSIDPIEAAMWTSGIPKESTGIAAYKIAEAMAAENLKQGLSVIVDAVNPVEEARAMWRALAKRFSVEVFFIEVHCSDEGVHRARIEKRVRNIEGMSEITWYRVQDRRAEYEPWSEPRLTLDTATGTPDILVSKALNYLRGIPAQ